MRPRIKHCTVWVRRVTAWITDNCAISVGRLVSPVWLPRWWCNIWFSISLWRRTLFWFWGDMVRVWVINWNWHSHFVLRWYYVLSYQQRPRGQLNHLGLNQVVLKLECSQVSLCWKVGSMVIDNDGTGGITDLISYSFSFLQHTAKHFYRGIFMLCKGDINISIQPATR